MEGSITLLSFIVSIGMFLGAAIVLFLFFKKSSKTNANIFLGVVILSALLHLLCPFAYFIGWFEHFPMLFRSERFLGFAVGPCIYLYIRSCTQKDFEMRPILWLHFLPTLIDIAFSIPIMMISPEQKIEYFRQFMNTGIFQGINEPRIIPITKVLHAITYGVISFRLILQYRKHLTETTSFIDEAYHRWLLVFSSYLIYPFFIALIFTMYSGSSIVLTLFYFGFVFFILAVFASTLLKPEIFHTFPHQMPIPNSSEYKTQKYENSSLQEDQKEKYLKILLNHIEKERPYLEPELTLAQLSEQTNIPSHYLSQIINEKMQCNFLDFINKYRVKEAKLKLADHKFDHFTIIAIAFEAGFNSKTTFYSAFKKFADTTPSGYRKSLKAS